MCGVVSLAVPSQDVFALLLYSDKNDRVLMPLIILIAVGEVSGSWSTPYLGRKTQTIMTSYGVAIGQSGRL